MTVIDDYLATFDAEPGYLNWAAFGPLSPTVRAEVFADADLLGSGRPTSIGLVWERVEQAKTLAAQLLAGDASEVTLHPSSTHALMQALYGLDGEVVASTAEFPSVSLHAAAGRAGLTRGARPAVDHPGRRAGDAGCRRRGDRR